MIRANRLDRMLGIGTLAALVIGCLLVLTPFVTALLMAVILTYSSWPRMSACAPRLDHRPAACWRNAQQLLEDSVG